jgi:Fusaric acid resistance protein-like
MPNNDLRDLWRSLFRLSPADGDHRAAFRVGASVAVPTIALILGGRTDLIIYAVFGAFTGMYGRAESHQLRVVHQVQAGVLLVTGTAIGVSLSALHLHSWVLIGVASLFAAAGSLFADRVRLIPAGPFFGLFALGACSAVPLAVDAWVAVLLSAASAAFSVVVGFAGWFRTREWIRGIRRPTPTTRGDREHTTVPLAVGYAASVGLAGSVSMLAGIGHPYWAMAAAAVPLAAASTSGRVLRGIHRVLGTMLGLVVTAVIVLILPTDASIVFATLVIALQFPTELFMTRNYALALVFFTPLILIMTQLANPANPGVLLVDRAVETLLGATIGIGVVLAMRPWASRRT